MGAIWAGLSSSTSVYQSTACHRSGSDLYAWETMPRSKPAIVGSSVDSPGPVADSNVSMSSVATARRPLSTLLRATRRTTVKR